MTIRILFLGEGTSDSGIAVHVRRIVNQFDTDVVITDPLIERLPPPPRRTVAAKLQSVVDLGGVYDLIVIHRDADRSERAARVREIKAAVDQVCPGTSFSPVVPVRMTEAWLLLDEAEIRRVAGNPNDRTPLGLPRPSQVENVADPKETLGNVLRAASGLHGRKLENFRKRFPQHRRQLLERIDPDGPISAVRSWRDFNADLLEAIALARSND